MIYRKYGNMWQVEIYFVGVGIIIISMNILDGIFPQHHPFSFVNFFHDVILNNHVGKSNLDIIPSVIFPFSLQLPISMYM